MTTTPTPAKTTLYAAGPLVSASSLQTGAGVGTTLLPAMGVFGVVGLRQLFAALVLLPVVVRERRSLTWRAARPALILGVMLLIMNFAIYAAFARISLGLAVTLEFLGPLTLALLASRRLVDLICGIAAGAGVFLLTGTVGDIDFLGVLFALAGGAAWAGYIVFGQTASRALPGAMGMAVASCTATVFTLPVLIVILIGLPSGEMPRVLLLGLVIGVLSSALPYTIDLAVLKRLPRGLFSVLQSVHPAAAAVSGFLILGQVLAPAQIAGILVITLANVAAVVGAGRRRGQAKRAEEALIA